MTDLGRRFVTCFVRAADDAGLPDDPEFRATLRDSMVWAVEQSSLLLTRGFGGARRGIVPRWSGDWLVSR